MKDGLYRVTTPRFVAGFVVAGGRVTRCAPILRKRLAYWKTVAVLVTPGSPPPPPGSQDPSPERPMVPPVLRW